MTVPIIARYAKNLGIDRNEQDANSVCATSAEYQDTQQANVRKQDAAIVAAPLTKALRASPVLNTSALIAKARSSRKVTTETIGLECKNAANAAARPTKAPRASRVLNTSAPIAKARSNQRATTETIALEWKPRYATNAVKQVTARTNARFVRAMHVVFEVTNYKRAICVQNTCALYVTATKNQKVTTTIYAHVQSAKRASYSVT